MNRRMVRLFRQIGRVVSLVLLAGVGTVFLMRLAPGYFSDAGELDPEHAGVVRAQMQEQEDEQGKIVKVSTGLLVGWLHGDFGRSRQYDVPVTELIGPRVKVTAKLLLYGVTGGWLAALLLALPAGIRQGARGEGLITGINIALLAVPAGALCTALLVTDWGGPVAALVVLIAARDFKLVYRLVRRSRMATCLTYARAQGVSTLRLTCFHLLPSVSRELLAIGAVSVVLALSSIVPIEVIFDVPGLGQLAWSAAMNRDLPVLLNVTVMMAACVGLLTMATDFHVSQEAR